MYSAFVETTLTFFFLLLPSTCIGSINVLYHDPSIKTAPPVVRLAPIYSPFLWRATERGALFRNRCKTHSQTVFDPRNKPTSPRTVATTPPTNIHIDLSVAEPVKNREMSELDESYALMPKIRRRMPPARTASETALFIDKPSFCFPYLER